MRKELKLYMVMLGCTPKGRVTEQHDVFFGIGTTLKELIPAMNNFWPEAKGKLHIDVWREVTVVEEFQITIEPKNSVKDGEISEQLFFLNLGGYKPNEFEEYHYRVLAVGSQMSDAIKKAKNTLFYKHYGFKGATSHIDEKFGIDIDDRYAVSEILTNASDTEYFISVKKSEVPLQEDVLHIGYLKFDKIV